MLRSSCSIVIPLPVFLCGLVPNRMDLGRSGGSSEGRRLERGKDCGWVSVDHGEKGARRSLGCPAPSLPMFDGVKAEAETSEKTACVIRSLLGMPLTSTFSGTCI